MRPWFPVALAALGAAAPAAGQDWGEARLARGADSIAGEALRGGRVAGMTVAVVRGGDMLFLKGYGHADRERGIPSSGEVVYPIASVSKQFTAAAIVQLADRGRLSLDAEVTTYLPEMLTQGRRVTLRQLVHHTAGVRGFTEWPGPRPKPERDAAPDEWIARGVPTLPFGSGPGEAMVYSNTGYLLLGQVVERVTGTPWAEYVRRNLLEPAGMPRTHECGERDDASRARGYARGSRARPLTPWMHRWIHSSGGLCSTAGDLAAWNRALHGGRLLAPAAYREMISPGRLEDGTPLRYAKGFVVDSAFGRRVIHHGGALSGYRSELRYFPDDSLSVIVLVNDEAADAAGIAGAIAGLIYGPAARDDAPPASANWREFAGTYRGPRRGRSDAVVVRAGRDGLVIIGSRPLPARHTGGDTFQWQRERFTFLRTGGRVTGLRVDGTYAHAVMQRRK